MSEWTVDNMVEVKLSQPDDFLKSERPCLE